MSFGNKKCLYHITKSYRYVPYPFLPFFYCRDISFPMLKGTHGTNSGRVCFPRGVRKGSVEVHDDNLIFAIVYTIHVGCVFRRRPILAVIKNFATGRKKRGVDQIAVFGESVIIAQINIVYIVVAEDM